MQRPRASGVGLWSSPSAPGRRPLSCVNRARYTRLTVVTVSTPGPSFRASLAFISTPHVPLFLAGSVHSLRQPRHSGQCSHLRTPTSEIPFSSSSGYLPARVEFFGAQRREPTYGPDTDRGCALKERGGGGGAARVWWAVTAGYHTPIPGRGWI